MGDRLSANQFALIVKHTDKRCTYLHPTYAYALDKISTCVCVRALVYNVYIVCLCAREVCVLERGVLPLSVRQGSSNSATGGFDSFFPVNDPQQVFKVRYRCNALANLVNR